jgi:hypothetical protein
MQTGSSGTLILAGNLVKPRLSLYGTEWRERGYGPKLQMRAIDSLLAISTISKQRSSLLINNTGTREFGGVPTVPARIPPSLPPTAPEPRALLIVQDRRHLFVTPCCIFLWSMNKTKTMSCIYCIFRQCINR